MQISPRVDKMLRKYAPLIGGVDENDQFVPFPLESKLKELLFYVKNREMDDASGEFMLGHVIRGKIIDGIYDIEYVGLNRYSRRPKDGEAISREHQKVLDRIEVLAERQKRDVVQAKISQLASLGIYVDENDVIQELNQLQTNS